MARWPFRKWQDVVQRRGLLRVFGEGHRGFPDLVPKGTWYQQQWCNPLVAFLFLVAMPGAPSSVLAPSTVATMVQPLLEMVYGGDRNRTFVRSRGRRVVKLVQKCTWFQCHHALNCRLVFQWSSLGPSRRGLSTLVFGA